MTLRPPASMGQDGTVFGQHVLVHVGDYLGEKLTEEGDLAAGLVDLLDRDHGRGDEGALADKVNWIELGHWLEESGLRDGSGASYSEGHDRAVTDVRVGGFASLTAYSKVLGRRRLETCFFRSTSSTFFFSSQVPCCFTKTNKNLH